MTSGSAAIAEWRPVSVPGTDRCRLVQEDDGWMLVGHARFSDAGDWVALDYVVRCDAAWHTLSADVTGVHGDQEVAFRIRRESDDWTLNDTPQPDVQGARDLDLSFTPATNLMPLRRLKDAPLRLTAAWLAYPDAAYAEAALCPLVQRYRPVGDGRVMYLSDRSEALMTVHPTGFVTDYPGGWRGEVRDAG